MTEGLSGFGFDIDLRNGQLREGALAEILRAHGDRIEVKSDQKCKETGNLFIEFRQHGRPSGIAITKAEWWAFEYEDNRWLIIPTEDLRRIAGKAWKAKLRANGGDFNNYEGMLVPIDWLIREPFSR